MEISTVQQGKDVVYEGVRVLVVVVVSDSLKNECPGLKRWGSKQSMGKTTAETQPLRV
jgi:hypothetical protein